MSLVENTSPYPQSPPVEAYVLGPKLGNRPVIVIESPYRDEPMAFHYLGECVKDSISKGEAPIASHGFYTRWLEDSDQNQRSQGIDCQLALIRLTRRVVFYHDLGVSEGMRQAITYCAQLGVTIEWRELGPDWRKRIPVGKTQPPAVSNLTPSAKPIGSSLASSPTGGQK